MGDRRYLIEFESGKTNVYYVNQLRQCKERVDYVNSFVIEADMATNEEDRMLPGIDDDDGSQTHDSGQLIVQMERSLTDDQRSLANQAVLDQYSLVFRQSLGRTLAVTHDIQVPDARPFVKSQ